MSQNKIIYVVIFLLMVMGAADPVVAQSNSSQPDIRHTIEQSLANDAFWSVVVRDSTGQILERYNDEKLVRPASNIKLLTSAAILDELGPDYTFKTKIYGIGYQAGGTWEGDIIIRGSGDPSISGTFYNEDRFHVFDKFYSAIDSMGIQKINGNLIGNTAFFDEQPYPEGWSWQDLSFYYGVEISALSFNNNAVDLRVYADVQIGEKPRIEWFPFDTKYVSFVNEQVITPRGTEYDEYYRRLLGTNTILLRSKLPKGYIEKESLSILNAPRFFLDTFKKYLEYGDVSVNGRIIVDPQEVNWNSKRYKLLTQHESKPLKKLLTRVNKKSDNFYTEMLLKTVAAEHYNARGNTELGLSLVEDFAVAMKMDTTKLEMNDGSGMAANTLVSVDDLSQMLIKMQEHPHFNIYKKSLSIAGVDGSLKNRFVNTPLEGKLFGKTGYVSGVRSISGYMNAKSGQTLAFSVVTNNYTDKTSYIDYVQDKLIKQLYKKF
ncbi:D-alanyl-D-alanine carboxypeptidase/D-alanyl-D-alanine endopeptidase [Fodinibius halophilus]|uniref:D-alanyl-D-alanine carboxypeptidase/D-alanyl-D-alanine-endopeptidase n=1 Tax=Fodinibius halophilus TaxID=1736908 RepID=A0A6M1T2B8_9BACT|nr:D-alanyl-D-alanine carboxypeptidase/D-alanyl-D-alanine-endopeptidase [Fodinibius halophilus]NGP86773.1 D-alanyl-D-alanine carboxypeptidase/D-alanyl-D-alanine-endopeptidase [Fodinibius halophilus]